MTEPASAPSLPKAWVTPGGQVWHANGWATYVTIPYDALPEIHVEEDFAFLRRGDASGGTASSGATENGANGTNGTNGTNGPHAEHTTNGDGDSDSDASDDDYDYDAMSFPDKEEIPGLLAKHAAAAVELGLALPASFVAFFSDFSLGQRIPTCTACYFDLASSFLRIHGAAEGARALRFLNDQQSCVFWLLLLEPGKDARVICGYPEWDDEDDGESEEEGEGYKLVEPSVCAESFPEFIKRFHMENVLWFGGSQHHAPLQAELDAYTAATRKAVGEGKVPGVSIPERA